jgi:hypothetical protein
MFHGFPPDRSHPITIYRDQFFGNLSPCGSGPSVATGVRSAGMPVPPADLLDRMAATMRTQVGPAVEEPFAKTQAFMAAVILDKLAGQLRGAEADAHMAHEERHALVAELLAELAGTSTTHVGGALASLGGDGRDAAWSALVEAIYTDGDELGADRFARMLGRVRVAMRARLDRMLVYAA